VTHKVSKLLLLSVSLPLYIQVFLSSDALLQLFVDPPWFQMSHPLVFLFFDAILRLVVLISSFATVFFDLVALDLMSDNYE